MQVTSREKQFLRQLAKGRTDQQIVEYIGGRLDQVRSQRVRLLAKLQISSQVEIEQAAERLAPWWRK